MTSSKAFRPEERQPLNSLDPMEGHFRHRPVHRRQSAGRTLRRAQELLKLASANFFI